jgi:3-oxocholest-4-en-26-oyl-CoA dehydrogenase beta subunit
MDFSYREEQLQVRELAVQILGDKTLPERQRELDESGTRFDEGLWQALAEAGLLGVALEEEHGGMGFDFETLCLLLEEAGRYVAAVPLLPTLVSAALPLQRFGSPQQTQCLGDVAQGRAILTAALLEPNNEDASRPSLQAKADGDHWILNGQKHCVPYLQQAQSVLLTAQSEGELLVLLVDVNAAGMTVTPQQATAGEPQAHCLLENYQAAAGSVVARGDQAGELVQWMLLLSRAATSSIALGLCDRMMRMTAEYTSQREQFGVPVATFQAVGHRAADCYVDVECLRLVVQQAVSLLTLELDAEEAVTIAKIWAGDVCHRVSQASQHLHGGIGVDRDYPLFRYCLWARQLELSLGTSARLTEQLGVDIALEFAEASP